MLTGLLGLIVPIALKALGWYLDSKQANKEMKKRFFEFAEKISGEYLNSVKLHDSYKRQLKALKKENNNG